MLCVLEGLQEIVKGRHVLTVVHLGNCSNQRVIGDIGLGVMFILLTVVYARLVGTEINSIRVRGVRLEVTVFVLLAIVRAGSELVWRACLSVSATSMNWWDENSRVSAFMS